MLGQITVCPQCGAEVGPIAPADFHCPEVLVLISLEDVMTELGITEDDLAHA